MYFAATVPLLPSHTCFMHQPLFLEWHPGTQDPPTCLYVVQMQSLHNLLFHGASFNHSATQDAWSQLRWIQHGSQAQSPELWTTVSGWLLCDPELGTSLSEHRCPYALDGEKNRLSKCWFWKLNKFIFNVLLILRGHVSRSSAAKARHMCCSWLFVTIESLERFTITATAT